MFKQQFLFEDAPIFQMTALHFNSYLKLKNENKHDRIMC